MRMIDFDGRFCFEIKEKQDILSLYICAVIILIITFFSTIYNTKKDIYILNNLLPIYFGELHTEINDFIFNKDSKQRITNIKNIYNYNKISQSLINLYTGRAYNLFNPRYAFEIATSDNKPLDTLGMLYTILEQISPTEIKIH